MRRIWRMLFKGNIYEFLHVVSVGFIIAAGIKIIFAPQWFDLPIIAAAIILTAFSVYKKREVRKKEEPKFKKVTQKDLELLKQSEEPNNTITEEDLLKSEIVVDDSRFEDIKPEVLKNNSEIYERFTDTEPFGLKSVLKSWHVDMENMLDFYRYGDIYDKIMFFMIAAAVIAVFEPLSYFGLVSDAAYFFGATIVLLSTTFIQRWTMNYFLSGFIVAAKLMLFSAYWDIIIIAAAAAVVALTWFIRKKRRGSAAGDAGFIPVTEEDLAAAAVKKPVSLSSRFEGFAEDLMVSPTSFDEEEAIRNAILSGKTPVKNEIKREEEVFAVDEMPTGFIPVDKAAEKRDEPLLSDLLIMDDTEGVENPPEREFNDGFDE